MEKKREGNSHIARDWAKKGEGSVPPAKNQGRKGEISLFRITNAISGTTIRVISCYRSYAYLDVFVCFSLNVFL